MSLQVVFQCGGNPDSNKKNSFKIIFLVLLLVIINVPFCHEDRERCKLDILIVVSYNIGT